jgi:hypothetical protein
MTKKKRMNRTLLKIGACCLFLLPPAMEATARQVITANPMNLNYRFYPPEKQDKGREAADPVCEYFKGKYYLFASKSGGYWSSTDLANWTYIPCKTITTIENYAPTILIYDNAIYYAGSGKSPKIFKNENPDVDNWVEVEVKFNTQIEESLDDVAFFSDDTGKTYMYWGCSDKKPIRGIQIEPENGFNAVGEPVTLIEHHFEKYGWEAPGDKNQNNKKGYNEGPCMIKHNGKYYLQYAAPGTQWRNYGDGIYTSDNPLGPYVYDETSPFSFKPGGFIGGAGHGHTFKDKYGNYWHVASMTIAVKHMFERRLGLFPVYFSQSGHIHAYTVLTDYPFEVPQKKVDFTKSDFSKNWNLLSYRKPAVASSYLAGYEPEKATDEMVETFWSSETGNAGEWLRIDLGDPVRINALQINFADHEFNIRGFQTYFNYQYIVEASNDGNTWTKLIDRADNKEDKPHDFIVLDKPATVRYLKITNTREVPGKFSLMGFRIFGKGNGKVPKAVAKLNISREEDVRRYELSWDASEGATGYIIRWGINKNELKNSTMVMGDTQLEAGYFNRDSKYYFSIDSFNENGITSNEKVYE